MDGSRYLVLVLLALLGVLVRACIATMWPGRWIDGVARAEPGPCPRCGSSEVAVRWGMIDRLTGLRKGRKQFCAGCGMRRGSGIWEAAPPLPEAAPAATPTLAAFRAAKESVRAAMPGSHPIDLAPPPKPEPPREIPPIVQPMFVPRPPQGPGRPALWDRELDG